MYVLEKNTRHFQIYYLFIRLEKNWLCNNATNSLIFTVVAMKWEYGCINI